jgi:glycosyltransferase involved in cell wall biosynthesis
MKGFENLEQHSVPSVSVVTVCRNNLAGLTRTVASVRAQTLQSVQHIIIDGASTDGTPAYGSALDTVRTTFVSEPDKGIYDAMNKGLAFATGDLVVMMNSDDTFSDPTDLAFVYEDYLQMKWRWAYGAVRYTDSKGVPMSGVVQAPFNIQKLALGLAFVPHQAMYVSRDLAGSVGPYRLDLDVVSDQEMALRCARVAVPRTWIRFLADCSVGGVHVGVSRWQRDAIYSRVRREQGMQLAGIRSLDVAFALWSAARWIGRDAVVPAVRGLLALRHTADSGKAPPGEI